MSSSPSHYLRLTEYSIMIVMLGLLAAPRIVAANEMTIGFTVSDGISSSSSSSAPASSNTSSSASTRAEIIGGNSRKTTDILESITSEDLPEIIQKRMLPGCDVTEKRIPLRYFCDPVLPTATTPLHQATETSGDPWYHTIIRYLLPSNERDSVHMTDSDKNTRTQGEASGVLRSVQSDAFWWVSSHRAPANGYMLLLMLLIGMIVIMIAIRIIRHAHRSFRGDRNLL